MAIGLQMIFQPKLSSNDSRVFRVRSIKHKFNLISTFVGMHKWTKWRCRDMQRWQGFWFSWVVLASYCSLSLLSPSNQLANLKKDLVIWGENPCQCIYLVRALVWVQWQRDDILLSFISILKQQQAAADRKWHLLIGGFAHDEYSEVPALWYSLVWFDLIWFGLVWFGDSDGEIWECWWPPSLRPILGWDGPTPRRATVVSDTPTYNNQQQPRDKTK